MTMVVAITGSSGFLGWHTACRLRALHGVEARLLSTEQFRDPDQLVDMLSSVDTIMHLAGVNRAGTDAEVEEGNLEIAQRLCDAMGRANRPFHVVYANSVHEQVDSPYGRSKRRAAELMAPELERIGGRLSNVILPNLFGEHGRPGYNSFVATFAHAVATGHTPTVTDDREIPLLHAQDAAEVLIQAALRPAAPVLRPVGRAVRVSSVRDTLLQMHDTYADGDVPPLDDPFHQALFNTYRAFLFPNRFPVRVAGHHDARGDLYEVARSYGRGQAFVSTTARGHSRGDHYHLRRFERFFVIRGEAEINVRRLLHSEVLTFRLNSEEPGFVDMPSLWVHNIRNTGTTDLLTAFWSSEILDPARPDQFAEAVMPRAQRGSAE